MKPDTRTRVVAYCCCIRSTAQLKAAKDVVDSFVCHSCRCLVPAYSNVALDICYRSFRCQCSLLLLSTFVFQFADCVLSSSCYQRPSRLKSVGTLRLLSSLIPLYSFHLHDLPILSCIRQPVQLCYQYQISAVFKLIVLFVLFIRTCTLSFTHFL
jgi:hypothetical protein